MDELSTSLVRPDTRADLLDLSIGEVLRGVAAKHPSRDALVYGAPDDAVRKRWSYSRLLADAERVAGALLTRFEPGDRVAIWASNRPEWILLQLGANLSGIVLVTVNPAYRVQELAYVLEQSRAAGIVHEHAYRGVSLAAVVAEVRGRLSGLRVAIDMDDWDGFVMSSPKCVSLPNVDPSTACQIQYTSGTTGFAKGALLHHRGAINAAFYSAERAGFGDGDTWINPIPLFHVGGSVLGGLGAISHSGTHVLVPGFDPALVLELIESEGGNLIVTVPTMLHALLDHPDRSRRDLSSLRTIMSGSSTVAPELVRRTKSELGCNFTILFGQTEVHGVLTQTFPSDTDEDQATTIGRALPHASVKVADPVTGAPVPIGHEGEICAMGYQTMLGYFEMPEATALVFDAEGWLHTGDAGAMDGRGYLTITGRLKDIIIRGGENIHPQEVEERLLEHTDVAEVCVLGLTDPRWGEQVAAVIRPVSGRELPGVAALHAHCRETLAPFKTPKYWYFVESFPVTPSGKIQRFVLREQILSGELEETK